MPIRSWFRKITETGVAEEKDDLMKMSVTLSNIIAIVLLFIVLSFFITHPAAQKIIELPVIAVGLLMFTIYFLLTNYKYFEANRFFLSWGPPIFICFKIIFLLGEDTSALPLSNYLGYRYYFIALGIIPFVVFSVKEPFKIFIGSLPTIFLLLFFDHILAFSNQLYFSTTEYGMLASMAIRRSVIAYLFVSGASFALKYLLELYNTKNKELIEQLDAQNTFIQHQSQLKLDEANHQLKLRLQDLGKRESMLKLSQHIAKIGSWEFGADQKFTFWSEEMYEIFDIETDISLSDIDYTKLINNEKWEGFFPVSRELIQEKGEFDLNVNIRTRTGYSKWIRVYAFIEREKNDLVAVKGICHDITQAKESEMLLRASENKYRGLFEQSFYPILLINPDGLILDANKSLSLLTQLSKEQYLLKNINEFIQFADGKKHNFNRSNYVEETLGKIISISGQKLLVEVNWKVMPSDRVIMTLRDVTKIKAAEKQIIESEERYKELVENATEALVVFSTGSNRFINVSKSAEDLFKTSQNNLLQMGFNDISPIMQPSGQESSELLKEIIEETLKNGKKSFNWTCQDSLFNEIPVEIRLIKIPSKNDAHIRGSIIDISDRIEKSKELEIANKKIGELKLIALRSVMSPHFIFNVLNSIQYFIGKNERLNAINYLSTFSKLIRSVLTHSIDNKIKLSDEVEMLKNYIQLEMLRFEEKFSFNLIIEPDLEIDNIEIPSLLIQPYVENAILHGLYNKAGKGKLTIEIKEKGDVVYFTIEDDGIGRKAAKQLNDKNFPGHQSYGLKLTEERLNLINENRNVSFYIEDLEKEGVASGTRVTIGILT